MSFSPIKWTGRVLQRIGTKLQVRSGIKGTWIDVGAHHGEVTLGYAEQNPGLKVYAFEPNLRAAAILIGRAPNFFVIPMAVAESDGHAQFHVNTCDGASSMLQMNENVRRAWIGGETLQVEAQVTVPTIRLDTFMNLFNVASVDFLKVDAQGMDLAVIRSAGSRLRDIDRIMLEVDLSPEPLYRGAASKGEVLEFMRSAGFRLESAERQTHEQEENLTFARHDLQGVGQFSLKARQKAETDRILPRVWRFWQKPWREKVRWVGLRWRQMISRIPRPVRLPFGAYFVRRNDSLGLNLPRFETRELAFVERLLRPGMTVLDIGAHQGLYTLLASRRVGPSGRVFSFEPSPRERRALRLNVTINFCENVVVQALALGSQETTADLYVVDKYNTGYNSLRPPNVPEPTCKVAVRVRTLDNWLAEEKIARVDFIKLDVEGAELSVLKGARELLALTRPVLLVEIAQIRTVRWGYDAVEIVRFLEDMGYVWFEILDGGNLAPANQTDQCEMNLVAVRRGQEGELVSRVN